MERPEEPLIRPDSPEPRGPAVTPRRLWLYPTVILVLYGFFKEMRPSEPFLTPYLRQDMNLTEADIDNKVYPIWTYSYMCALVFVFLLTDLFLYKPVILFEGVTYLVTWALLIWGRGVGQMQLMQFVYGFATATEIAYYSYIYAAVPSSEYKKVTSYTRAAILSGDCVSGVIGQVLYTPHVLTLFQLNILSFSSICVALVFAILLPSVRTSLYFHTNTTPHTVPGDNDDGDNPGLDDETETEDTGTRRCERVKHTFTMLWSDFKMAYTQRQLLIWSLWWAFATCGEFQVSNYVQVLWEDIAPSKHNHVYNGGVEAVLKLLGAAVAFSVQYTNVNMALFGELILGAMSLLDAVLLMFEATTRSIWLAYGLYLIYHTTFSLLITVATYQIARNLTTRSYALVFGCNTFLALVMQTVLTLVLVDEHGLHTGPVTQFVVYSGYFFLIGAIFLTKGVYDLTVYGWASAWADRKDPGTGAPSPGTGVPSPGTGGEEQQHLQVERPHTEYSSTHHEAHRSAPL